MSGHKLALGKEIHVALPIMEGKNSSVSLDAQFTPRIASDRTGPAPRSSHSGHFQGLFVRTEKSKIGQLFATTFKRFIGGPLSPLFRRSPGGGSAGRPSPPTTCVIRRPVFLRAALRADHLSPPSIVIRCGHVQFRGGDWWPSLASIPPPPPPPPPPCNTRGPHSWRVVWSVICYASFS